MQPLIFLIGFRGTGKTTVGQLLAERLGWEFVDADAYLEIQHGATVRAIFRDEGESGFRAKETATLQELCRRTRHVVATGGGIILSKQNRELLGAHGWVAWLTGDAESLWQRIQADPLTAARRPNLSNGGLAEVEEMLALRAPFYRECADFEIDTIPLSPSQVASAILTACQSSIIR